MRTRAFLCRALHDTYPRGKPYRSAKGGITTSKNARGTEAPPASARRPPKGAAASQDQTFKITIARMPSEEAIQRAVDLAIAEFSSRPYDELKRKPS